MKETASSEDEFDIVMLVRHLAKWWKVLLVVTVAAFGLTFLVLKLTTPLYESYAILYPTRSNNRDKQMEEFAFGFEIQSERLMQLLQSDIILDSINQQFGLVAHYQIDTTDIAWYDRLLKKARSRIQFAKTRYSSVVVSVMDESPDLAAGIANEISHLVNLVNADIVKSNAREVLEAVEAEYERRSSRVSAINDSIVRMQEGTTDQALGRLEDQVRQKQRNIKGFRKHLEAMQSEYHVFDYETQVNALNSNLATARADFFQESGRLESLETDGRQVADSAKVLAKAGKAGADRRVKYFEGELNQLSSISSEYNRLQDQLNQEKLMLQLTVEQLAGLQGKIDPKFATRNLQSLERDYDWDQLQTRELKRKYQQALSNFLEPAPAAYLISRARPSHIAVYPHTKTSLILGTLGALLFAMVVILFYERLQKGRIN